MLLDAYPHLARHWPTWLTTSVARSFGGAARSVAALEASGRPFIFVTGQNTHRRFPWVERAQPAALDTIKVRPRFGQSDVALAADTVNRLRPDVVVAVGGGSVIDMAKLLRLTHDECGKRDFELRVLPTLAGSGSEVTPWASLWDGGIKSSREHRAMLPDFSLIDPTVTSTASAGRQTTSMLDAMAHAIEAIWGVHRSDSSVAIATEALRILVRSLPAVAAKTADGTGERAFDVAGGGALAGVALCHTRSAGAHAISYHLTGHYGVEHGVAVGVLSAALLHDLAGKAPDIASLVLTALQMDSPDEFSECISDAVVRASLIDEVRSEALHHKGLGDAIAFANSSTRASNHPVPIDNSTLEAVSREFRTLLVKDGIAV